MEHVVFAACADRCTALALDFSDAEIAPSPIWCDLILTTNPAQSKLVLASSSPRRVALLVQAGLCFNQVTPCIDEAIRPGESPHDYVVRLSMEKARDVSLRQEIAGDAIVIAADTIVVIDGNILGKPVSKLHASNRKR